MTNKEIDLGVFNCCDCPYSYTEEIFEPDLCTKYGLYCELVDEDRYYGSSSKGHKLVACTDRSIQSFAIVPKWCPKLNHI